MLNRLRESSTAYFPKKAFGPTCCVTCRRVSRFPGIEDLTVRTPGRAHTGAAMFYFVADVRIRQQTNNRKGLQDALQAVVASGQTIAIDATPEAVFAFADKSVGVSVMLPLYQQVSEHAVPEDLNALWTALGVRSDGSGVVYNDQAPLASVRKAIFRPHPVCGVSQ